MCGLFGQFSATGIDVAKMQILGLYNQSRGKHSCGIYNGEVLKHGIAKDAEFNKFMETFNMFPEKESSIFIGHTRHATVGAHTVANAAPFDVDPYIFSHNGTIYNIQDLTAKYNVDTTGIQVDSKQFGKLIKEKGFNVLNEYIGYAALAFYNKEENSLYLYHGASTKDKEVEEERPMYVIERDNEIYYSSIPTSLETINEFRDTVNILPYNTVFKYSFVFGKLIKEKVYKVERLYNNLSLDKYLKPPIYDYSQFSHSTYNPKDYKPKEPYKSVTKDKELVLTVPEKINKNKIEFDFDFMEYTLNGFTANGVYHLGSNGDIVQKGYGKNYYFFKGNMLKDHTSFNELNRDKNVKTWQTSNFIENSELLRLSSLFLYPIVCSQSRDHYYYYNGSIFYFLEYCPLFGNKTISIYNAIETKTVPVKAKYAQENVLCHYDDYIFNMIDFSLTDKVYKSNEEFILNVNPELIEFLEEYFATFWLDSHKTQLNQVELIEFICNEVATAIEKGKTIREQIEDSNSPFEQVYTTLDEVLVESSNEDAIEDAFDSLVELQEYTDAITPVTSEELTLYSGLAVIIEKAGLIFTNFFQSTGNKKMNKKAENLLTVYETI